MSLRKVTVALVAVALVGLAVWRWRSGPGIQNQRTIQTAQVTATTGSSTGDTLAPTPAQVENLQRLQAAMASVQSAANPPVDRVELALKNTSDAFERHRLIGQLLDLHFA